MAEKQEERNRNVQKESSPISEKKSKMKRSWWSRKNLGKEEVRELTNVST